MNWQLFAMAGASAAGCILAVLGAVRPEINSLRKEMRALAAKLHTESASLE